MKKIIKGKVYDTDRAVRVGSWSAGEQFAPDYLEESLYRKKTGEYFLAGMGGCSTRYAVEDDDNRWKSGGRIIPLTYEAADDWAGTHLPDAEYKAAFGDPDPDAAGTENLVITLPAPMARRIRMEAGRSGTTISAVVEKLLTTAAVMLS